MMEFTDKMNRMMNSLIDRGFVTTRAHAAVNMMGHMYQARGYHLMDEDQLRDVTDVNWPVVVYCRDLSDELIIELQLKGLIE